MKTCNKISSTRCSPYNGPMHKDCELSEKGRCIFKKSQKNNLEENKLKKTCKKVSESRCSPYEGKMDKDCELSEKGRCIIIKNKKVKN